MQSYAWFSTCSPFFLAFVRILNAVSLLFPTSAGFGFDLYIPI